MIQAGISIDGHTNFHVFPKLTLTAEKYRDEILDHYVCLSIDHVFILMEDII